MLTENERMLRYLRGAKIYNEEKISRNNNENARLSADLVQIERAILNIEAEIDKTAAFN